MLKSKAWVVAVVAVAALLPAPPVQASELVKLAKLLVTGKRAPAATEAAKPVAPQAARSETGGERQAPVRATESGGGVLLNLRSEAQEVPAAAPTPEWRGEDRGESVPAARPVPAETNPTRGDRFETASAAPRRHLA